MLPAAVRPTPSPPPPRPTPLPATWADGLRSYAAGNGRFELVCSYDKNADGVLDGDDGLAGLDITLRPDEPCGSPADHSDFFTASPSDPSYSNCDDGRARVLIVAVASAGSDLREPSGGESLGLLDIVNRLQARLGAGGIASDVWLATAALFGAVAPQTSMEQWIGRGVALSLDALPCLRAVLIGHSHGGVTVTSVTAALDDRYASRMFGVAIDRTTKLYDRDATEMPSRTKVLNVFQTNEGWHGAPIDAPTVINDDESSERAPIALSDGGGGLALVTHKTLDDAPGVQGRVVDAVMGWLNAPPNP